MCSDKDVASPSEYLFSRIVLNGHSPHFLIRIVIRVCHSMGAANVLIELVLVDDVLDVLLDTRLRCPLAVAPVALSE